MNRIWADFEAPLPDDRSHLTKTEDSVPHLNNPLVSLAG
jgi:hypothetical protein